ncbi:MAG: helix-turn-helix transcriptional regulator [Nisaea sp.]|jgi:DNA-binding HxlR family transcriptional regulator|uniref:winged helix-turn-helix transcriptional regulator n=1 Tax=Nisaea sp. TaxID=2024842 RepID=UPI001B0FF2EB|nr:helix-turn-helix domain-containing protein [Nisaea sp.]MBO6561797.1 helix-turn-helix transcriptional regulator [Nisaea sp.]
MALKMRKNKVAPPPDGCPLSTCLSVIGGTWAPNIIWYLSASPRRFSELKADIPGVSAKMLTQRLKELQEFGVIARTVKPTSPPSVEYALTDLGEELVPAINAIVAVGHKLKARKQAAEAAA